MNLLYLLQKSDEVVRVEQLKTHVESSSEIVLPNGWKHDVIGGFHGVTVGRGWRIMIQSANRFWPEVAPSIGRFQAAATNEGESCLEVSWQARDGAVKAFRRLEDLQVHQFEDLVIPSCDDSDSTLSISVPEASDGPVFIAVFRPISRSEILHELSGVGVEIGPGTNPQVLPSSERAVTYVEAIPLDEWASRNSATRIAAPNPHLFAGYVAGTAANIPVKPNSLDFIFSSHVFEHLANPLGHLKYWASLLRPNGKVVAIIPDKACCRDFRFPLSTLADLEAEELYGEMNLSIRHYENWVRYQQPKSSPAKLYSRKVSIHAHFYTPSSLYQILKSTHRDLGFERFSIQHAQNHKDFHLTLRKAGQ